MNGTVGTVVDFCYSNGDSPKDGFPEYVLVDFPKYQGPELVQNHPTWIPVPPIERRCECECCTRTQVPLRLGWGLTIHKCQGMNIGRGELNKHIVITPGSCKFESQNPGALYVALSRAKGSGSGDQLPDFAFHPKVLLNADRLQHKPKSKSYQERVKEIERLTRESIKTRRDYSHLDSEAAFKSIISQLPSVEE